VYLLWRYQINQFGYHKLKRLDPFGYLKLETVKVERHHHHIT
jgi:hypothetical protein